MTQSEEMLEKAIEKAEQKLEQLEEEQRELNAQIEKTKNEISGLEKAIKRFGDLDASL